MKVKIGVDDSPLKSGLTNLRASVIGFFAGLGAKVADSLKNAMRKVKDLIIDAVKTAAAAEGIRHAFEGLNDPNLLSNLRKATKGTVSDLELMKAAVKANNFKIPLEQLGTLLKFAQQRAQETGESVDYMVQSIVTGIARKSLPILDNLGLSTVEIRKEFEATGDMAKAVGNIIKRDMNANFDTTQTTIDQLTAKFENFKVRAGSAIISAVNGIVKAFTYEIDTHKSLREQIHEDTQSLDSLIRAIKSTNAGSVERKTLINQLNTEYGKYLPKLLDEKSTLDEIDAAQRKVNESIVKGILARQYAEQRAALLKEQLDQKLAAGALRAGATRIQAELTFETDPGALARGQQLITTLSDIAEGFDNAAGNAQNVEQQLKDLEANIRGVAAEFGITGKALDSIFKIVDDGNNTVNENNDLTTKTIELGNDHLQSVRSLETEMSKLETQYNGLARAQEALNKLTEEAIDVDRRHYSALTDKQEAIKQTGTELTQAQMDLLSFQSAVGQGIESGIESFVDAFAEQVGELAAGTTTLEAAGLSILKIFGDFLKKFGSMLVAYGVAEQAFLTDPEPITKIIAGAALIAIGAGITSLLAKPPALAEGGLAFGPTLAVVGDNPGARSNPEVIAPLNKLLPYLNGGGGQGQDINVNGFIKGNDIWLTQREFAYLRNRTI